MAHMVHQEADGEPENPRRVSRENARSAKQAPPNYDLADIEWPTGRADIDEDKILIHGRFLLGTRLMIKIERRFHQRRPESERTFRLLVLLLIPAVALCIIVIVALMALGA
jgi:hypothetical protein